MIVAQNTLNNQAPMSRQQRRDIERKAAKRIKQLEKTTRQTALPVTFDNNTVTGFGLFGYLEAFKQIIGWNNIVGNNLFVKRRHNAKYPLLNLMDTLIDSVCLGLFRFSHMSRLQQDPGYQKVKNLDQVADESTLRYFLSQFAAVDIVQLVAINRQLLSRKFASEKPREIWLDFDDTVVTVFGEQEGSAVGYNPRYHGRASFKIKVAFISGTRELVYLKLYDGATASNSEFLDFLKETLAQFDPKQVIVKGIRADSGFFDNKLFTYLEDNNIEYICKAKMTSNIQKIKNYLEEQEAFEPVSTHYACAQIRVPLPTWERGRRFVLIRETLEPKEVNGQICLDLSTYEYQAIVTSLDELTAEEIWHEYNQRAVIENKIDELKTGLAVNQMSQHEFVRNHVYLWIKALAYNILNWFRTVILDESASQYEVSTIRRTILNVPGNVVGNGCYRHLRLAPNRELSKLVPLMAKNLTCFTLRCMKIPIPFEQTA